MTCGSPTKLRVFTNDPIQYGINSFASIFDIVKSPMVEDPEREKALANAAFREGRLEDALAGYDRALSLCLYNGDGAAPCFSNRSLVLLKLGRAREALCSAERAAAIRPAWSKAALRIQSALKALGRSEEASVVAEHAKKLKMAEKAAAETSEAAAAAAAQQPPAHSGAVGGGGEMNGQQERLLGAITYYAGERRRLRRLADEYTTLDGALQRVPLALGAAQPCVVPLDGVPTIRMDRALVRGSAGRPMRPYRQSRHCSGASVHLWSK